MKSFVLILLIFVNFTLVAQVIEIKRQIVKADGFKLDKIGHLYFVKDNVLTKTDKDLNVLFTYDDFAWGNISDIDVSNPLKIIVFYKDFNRIVYLDNNLAELRDPVLLDDLNYYNIDVVATTQQGGILIYDNQFSQVINLDQNLINIQQGTNLYSIIKGAQIIDMQISTDYIALQTVQNDILILDKFANFYTMVNANEVTPVCLDNNVMYYCENNYVIAFDINSKFSSKFDLSVIEIKDLEVSGDKIFVLSENSLITFQIL